MVDLLQIYKEEQSLTLNEENNIIILPEDQYSFTSYPLPENNEGCITLTKDEYFGFLLGRFMFNEDLTGITDYIRQSASTEEINSEEVPDSEIN